MSTKVRPQDMSLSISQSARRREGTWSRFSSRSLAEQLEKASGEFPNVMSDSDSPPASDLSDETAGFVSLPEPPGIQADSKAVAKKPPILNAAALAQMTTIPRFFPSTSYPYDSQSELSRNSISYFTPPKTTRSHPNALNSKGSSSPCRVVLPNIVPDTPPRSSRWDEKNTTKSTKSADLGVSSPSSLRLPSSFYLSPNHPSPGFLPTPSHLSSKSGNYGNSFQPHSIRSLSASRPRPTALETPIPTVTKSNVKKDNIIFSSTNQSSKKTFSMKTTSMPSILSPVRQEGFGKASRTISSPKSDPTLPHYMSMTKSALCMKRSRHPRFMGNGYCIVRRDVGSEFAEQNFLMDLLEQDQKLQSNQILQKRLKEAPISALRLLFQEKSSEFKPLSQSVKRILDEKYAAARLESHHPRSFQRKNSSSAPQTTLSQGKGKRSGTLRSLPSKASPSQPSPNQPLLMSYGLIPSHKEFFLTSLSPNTLNSSTSPREDKSSKENIPLSTGFKDMKSDYHQYDRLGATDKYLQHNMLMNELHKETKKKREDVSQQGPISGSKEKISYNGYYSLPHTSISPSHMTEAEL